MIIHDSTNVFSFYSVEVINLNFGNREKVTIPKGKSCIFIDGAGSRVTEIQWNDHQTTATSATFTSFAENLVVRGIAFRVVFLNFR